MARGPFGVALTAALAVWSAGVASSQEPVAAPLPTPGSIESPPSIAFEERSVVVSGLEPGGSVVLFGVSQGHNGFISYYLRHDEVLADEDGDGSVRWDAELLPERSVLVAVDLVSGELGLGSPAGFEPPPVAPAPALAAGGTELSERGRWV